MKRVIFFAAIISLLFFSFISCDLLSPGLGDKVDINHPFVFVSSHSNGDYITGTVNLSGNFDEDMVTASVQISFDAGVTWVSSVLNVSAETWSYSWDTSVIPDGEYNVIFKITDGSGKSTTKNLLVYVDNTGPLVLMTSPPVPGLGATYYGSTFQLRGESADRFGIASVVVEIWDEDEITLLATPTVSGGTTWSCSFDSAALIPVSGTLRFKLIVTDKAGNTGTFYHYNDIFVANESVNIGIDDIYRVLNGELSNSKIETFFSTNDGTAMISLYFDQDQNKPQIEVYNPDNSGYTNNILTNTSKISGKAIDSDGIATNSVEVRILRQSDSWVALDWTSSGNGAGQSVNWSYIMDGTLADDIYVLYVRAADIGGYSREVGPYAFSIDSGAPTLTVDTPEQGDYINGGFTISGTASDAQGISLVEVSTNNGVSYNTATGTTSWSYNVPSPADGSMLIKVRATEGGGGTKQTTYNLQVIIDTTDPTISFTNPAQSVTVNGQVIFKGTSSDNTQITLVELKVGKNDGFIELEDMTYNWEYTIDSTSYANSTHSTETGAGTDVWKLDVQARATDVAGNVTTLTTYYIYIDNDLDKPVVNIISPSNEQNIGGPVLVTGSAVDDDAVALVEMRIDINGDGNFSDQIDIGDGSSKTLDGDTNDRFEDETQWYTVTGTTVWSETINKFGELYARNDTSVPLTGNITIRVRAVDINTPAVVGNYQEISIHLDDTIPRIESLCHYPSGESIESGDFVSGTFRFTGDVFDDEQVSSILISYNGGVSYTNITSNPAMVTYVDVDHYSLDISIDSTSYIPTSGIFYLRLKVIDNANYQTISYLNLNVDNVYPTSTYTGNADDMYGSTANSRVQGVANDSGTVSGIDKIEVYFTRGTGPYTMYSPNSISTTAATTYNFGDGSGDVPYMTTGQKAAYVITIDKTTELGNDGSGNGDGDGYNESLTLSGSDYNWWADFNTANIPDGDITIHYVVFDKGGNGHHYTQAGVIKNYKPVINEIIVGSDVNFSDAVTSIGPDELTRDYSTAGYSSLNRFKARNRFYFEVDATDPGGTSTGIASYAFYHESTLRQTSASAVFEVDLDTPFNYSDGNTYFTCVVTDADGITVTTETIWVDIDKADNEDPSISIDEFPADPSAYIEDGYIEVKEASVFDNVGDIDADVSGTIYIKGSASDNHRINTVTITIDGGAANTVASWSSNQLQVEAAYAGIFIISNQSITADSGHAFDWSYQWNTATITDSADTDVRFDIEATDFSSTPAPRIDSATDYYDVVPYISDITSVSGYGLSESVIRSSSGKYSVDYDLNTNTANYLVIKGYNLNGTGRDTRITAAAILTPSGTNIEANITGTPNQYELHYGKEIPLSGYVTIFINGIPTLNNVNSISAAYNKEAETAINPRSALWTDDRYLNMWDTTEVLPAVDNQTFYYPDMIMNGNQPIFSYCDDNVGNTKLTTGDESYNNLIGLWYERQTAMARNSSGSYYIVSAEDAFTGNNIGYLQMNYGQVGTNIKSGAAEIDNLGYGQNGVIELVGEDWDPTGGGGNSRQLNRFIYPNIIVNGTDAGTQVYISYYDAHPDARFIRFFSFQTTDNTTDNLTEPTRDYQIASNGNMTITGTANASSEHTAMTLIGSDIAIAFYDSAAKTLKMRYSSNHTSGNLANTGATWTELVVDSNQFCGRYVSLVNDGTYVYLAYYDGANANLKFARINWATKAIENYVVDSYFSVGSWTRITLINGIPYISYYADSYNGTRDSIRLAYPLSTSPYWNGVTIATGAYTGDWEIMAVPTIDIPQGGREQFNHTQIGMYTQTVNLPVVGWLATRLEYSKLLPDG